MKNRRTVIFVWLMLLVIVASLFVHNCNPETQNPLPDVSEQVSVSDSGVISPLESESQACSVEEIPGQAPRNDVSDVRNDEYDVRNDISETVDVVHETGDDVRETRNEVPEAPRHSVPDTESSERTASVIPEPVIEADADVHTVEAERTASDRAVMALKTNMLGDLALTPNVEIEFPFAKDRFSIMAEYWFPWFHSRNNSWCHQLLYGGIEGRCWLGDRSGIPALSGHFIGIYGGGGIFDFEKKNIGYQSPFFYTAGLTYGYSFKIHRNLRIETSVSAGYLRAEYSKYEAVEDGRFLVWEHDGIFSWLGPTKAKVSLVWTIFEKAGNNMVKERG